MYTEAIAETRRSIELNAESEATADKGYLGLWLARSGKRDEAMKLLSELKQEVTRSYVQSYTLRLFTLGSETKRRP